MFLPFDMLQEHNIRDIKVSTVHFTVPAYPLNTSANIRIPRAVRNMGAHQ